VEDLSGAADIVAVRHLFRHLDDVASLRGNPVAEQLFGVSNQSTLDAGAIRVRIRSAVVTALDSLTPLAEDNSRSAQYARRLRTILERCDLHGEPHRTVAAELGICARQLYRDRQEAFARLTELFRNVTPAQEPQVSAVPASVDDVELQLKLVARLAGVGQFDTARTILRRLANQPLKPAQRALVTYRLVEELCRTGSISEARVTLGKAKGELAKASCAEPELSVIRAELSAADSEVALHSGDPSSAVDHAERGLALLRRHHHPNTERVRSLMVELSAALAESLWESGAHKRAIQIGDHAKAFIGEGVDPARAAALYLTAAQGYLSLQSGLDMALRENMEAYEIARRGGNARFEVIALGNLCPVHFLRGNYVEAMLYGQKALLTAEFVSSPMGMVQLLVNMARVAIALGNTAYALELLARARLQAAGNDKADAMLDVVEAEALTMQGRFEAAAKAARRARAVFENVSQKQLAPALCAEARAYAALGKKRSAVSVLRGAIDVAESFGSAFSVMNVYRASAEITGNKRHAKYAAGIDSALRA
jgi:tetratricopeptide (TPR) repeat protein